MTPASHSDISGVRGQTSDTYADANKWHLMVTSSPEAKTMRCSNMASASQSSGEGDGRFEDTADTTGLSSPGPLRHLQNSTSYL
ncbi:hypothetical protein KUCAC02_023130 [Chaenocephalus aceratus]|uniref:Uncharacterized protein n=1 Tax=Chaenocephalus aceratus TaxID=36190 RepID=A0ACB9XPS6_CHAAC|nr:hypothetical protein KUCAC02_023130 [Chaenocephalus aceratus]